ncbi:amino acid permease [Streptomyces antnestii]|uniref:Amino acid permease n=2 Tax=Streptomyces antnestii TaxID=2494256 RepID=A0A437NYN3_9ACTN|nr:amino acid permease [Streptomyces sp. San01]
MIGLGGAIGTGLFLGSATRMASTGPALLISFAVVGFIAFLMMRALGELVLHRPTSGAFVSYMREFYGERAAYITGWCYWVNWALTGIAELSAVALYVRYWWPDVPSWLTVIIGVAAVVTVNLLSVKVFGEFEFWASLLKVGAIVLFLVVGIVLVVFSVHIGGTGYQASIANLWQNPGGFWPTSDPYVWYGPVLVMSGVVFSYAAIEMVGVAAGEMKNPEREVPRAVNSVVVRILVFYIGSIFLLMCTLPTSVYGTTVHGAAVSPFVTVFSMLGAGWIGNVIQGILIIAAMSSLNSGLYVTGRILRSLGLSKQAPAFTAKMSSTGVPWAGIAMTGAVFLLGAVLNAAYPNQAFDIALEVSAIGTLATWFSLFVCQLRLRRLSNAGIIPASPFRMPFYPYGSYIGLVFLALVVVGMVISGWQSSPDFWGKTDFITIVIGVPVLALLMWLGWFLVKRNVAEHTGGKLDSRWPKLDRNGRPLQDLVPAAGPADERHDLTDERI